MQTADFDYHLPRKLIAQQPAKERTQARLMLVNRATSTLAHYHVSDLPDLLMPGDLMVLNDTRVIPARVFGRKQKTGGKVEVLFIGESEKNNLRSGDFEDRGSGPARNASRSVAGGVPRLQNAKCRRPTMARRSFQAKSAQLGRLEKSLPRMTCPIFWEAFLHSSGRPKIGDILELANGKITARVKSLGEHGRVILEISCASGLQTILAEEGLPPLPPYIKRPKDKWMTDNGKSQRELDLERYQTVYAETPGAIAAPTAGLHFSPALLAQLEKKGVQVEKITLHVGPGTFIPVKSERVEEHKMEGEQYVISLGAAQAINEALASGRRIVSVGTTVVRALESAVNAEGKVVAGADTANIFIYPPYSFRIINALMTNFHLPRSTLLMLVSAFACPQGDAQRGRQACPQGDPARSRYAPALRVGAQRGRQAGRELIRQAYAAAINEKYRFYSYGDCMLII
jgi:S-adenosylmethionine:tRNA ribosyltransferase-isomerase